MGRHIKETRVPKMHFSVFVNATVPSTLYSLFKNNSKTETKPDFIFRRKTELKCLKLLRDKDIIHFYLYLLTIMETVTIIVCL